MLMLGRAIEVPLDVTTESTPDVEPPSTEYWLVHKRRRGDTKQRRLNARKETMTSDFWASDGVCLHNVRWRKGRNPKLYCPWEGPYLVVSVLSDVTYHIQRSRRAKPKVIHTDRLKPYLH